MANYLKYETNLKKIDQDYGKIIAIYNDNTVDIVIGDGVDFYGNPLLVQRAVIKGNYVPKIGENVLIIWEGGIPAVIGSNTSTPIDINYSTIISSPNNIPSNIIDGNIHIINGTITASKLQAGTITAESGVIANAAIGTAQIQDLAVTNAKIANASIDTAKIADLAVTDAKILNIDASKITSGDISTERLTANVIQAINLATSDAKIDGAKIQNATIQDAHIVSLTADKIDSGNLRTNVMLANVIDAINLSTSNAVIDQAKIGNLDASKITSGDIDVERLKANVIDAINLSATTAKIDQAKIGDLDASKIISGDISTDRLKANVIEAINLSSSTATINGAKITDATITNAKISGLDASKIVSGDIAAERLKANVIEAINLSTSGAVIDQAKIGNLDASKITSGTIDTSKVIISTNATGTGARIDIQHDGINLIDANNNVIARFNTDLGFVVHSPAGMKLDNQGSIRIGPTDDIVIDAEGIKAKAGGTEYTALFTGDGLTFIEPNNPDNQLIITSGQLKITTDGGQTFKTALTAEGFYGDILLDKTLPPSKFDTTPPAIPTWREEGVTSILEQTPETQIVTIVVKWNEVTDSDLEGYKIYLEENNSGNFYPVAIVGKTNEYHIRGIKPNTLYRVMVSSFDIQGNECSTKLPSNTNFTTYPRSVITASDTVAPATPSTPPEVTTGFKLFMLTWQEVVQNQDSTPCYDLSYYEIQRSSSLNWDEWTTIAKIKGTSLIDKDVDYNIRYRYRYRAVDTSGNVSGWSPVVDAGSPAQVGAGDIVAHSITTEHISTAGLSADIITSGKIKGDLIEANTITADKFESRLYGDLVQALRYVESRLKVKVFEWLGTTDNYNQGTFNGTYAFNDILMLDTVYHWDTNINWDSGYYWDKPIVTSGFWESNVLDMGALNTILCLPKLSYTGPTGSYAKFYLKYSEDNIIWTDYVEFSGTVITARYLRMKVELYTPDSNNNVQVTSLLLQCYVDEPTVIQNDIDAHKNDFNNPHHVYHNQTQPLEVNELDTDTTKDKHISNLMAKQWEDHRLNNDLAAHGLNTTSVISVGGINVNNNINIGGKAYINSNVTDLVQIRNASNSDYGDLIVRNLTVKGTTTVIESQFLQIGDNVITLNSTYTGDSPTQNAGIEINRGTLTKASLIWDESNDVWKAGLAGSEAIIWTSATDGSGSGLDADLLDGQHASYFAPASHNHDSTYLKLSGGTLTGDLTFSITTKNAATKGLIWSGLTDTHKIFVEEYGNSESTRLVIYNADNGDVDYTVFRNYDTSGTSIDTLEVRRNYLYTPVQFRSGVTTGTAPFTINSTTKVTNLNVDMVDDCHVGNGANNILLLDTNGLVPLTNIPNVLTGKDADTVDGKHAADFVQKVSNAQIILGSTGWSRNNGEANVLGEISANNVSGDARLMIHSIGSGKTNVYVDGEIYVNEGNYKVWHAGNDGSGSGLDADLLDGKQASDFVLKSGDTMTGQLNVPLLATPVIGLIEPVYIRGTGLNHSANRIVRVGDKTLVNSSSRGLTLTILNASTHAHVSSTNYDVYGNAADSDALADALNGLTRDQIGILTSYDAIEYQITTKLRNAARRLGLFKLANCPGGSRRPYAAIFYGAGTTTGATESGRQAIEVFQSDDADAPYAIIVTWLIDDGFIGQNVVNALVSGEPNTVNPILEVGSDGIPRINNNIIWHAGNDGSGSGLDADLLDGMQPSTSATVNTIVQRDASGNITANTFNGTLNGNAATASKLQTARTITLSGDISGSASFDGSTDVTISGTLANSGVTAGTYTKVTVDAKGRVTSGTTLSASDIPNLDWSKITTGKPTTLSGYGITDAVRNAGNTPSIQAGLDANKPTAGIAGRLYIATDTKTIYRDDGTQWIILSSGSGGASLDPESEQILSASEYRVQSTTSTAKFVIEYNEANDSLDFVYYAS